MENGARGKGRAGGRTQLRFPRYSCSAARRRGGGKGGGAEVEASRGLEGRGSGPTSPPARKGEVGDGGGKKNAAGVVHFGAPPCACRGHWWAPRLISTLFTHPRRRSAGPFRCVSFFLRSSAASSRPRVFWVSSLHTRTPSPRPLRNFPVRRFSSSRVFHFFCFLFFFLFFRRPGPPPPLLWPPCLRYLQVSGSPRRAPRKEGAAGPDSSWSPPCLFPRGAPERAAASSPPFAGFAFGRLPKFERNSGGQSEQRWVGTLRSLLVLDKRRR